MLWSTITTLTNILIWPIVVLVAMWLYRKPLSKFLSDIGRRVTKLSALNNYCELKNLIKWNHNLSGAA